MLYLPTPMPRRWQVILITTYTDAASTVTTAARSSVSCAVAAAPDGSQQPRTHTHT
jgi:hypothetical protein